MPRLIAKCGYLAKGQRHRMQGRGLFAECEPVSHPPHQAGPDKTTEAILQVTVVPETVAFAPVIVYFVAPL